MSLFDSKTEIAKTTVTKIYADKATGGKYVLPWTNASAKLTDENLVFLLENYQKWPLGSNEQDFSKRIEEFGKGWEGSKPDKRMKEGFPKSREICKELGIQQSQWGPFAQAMEERFKPNLPEVFRLKTTMGSFNYSRAFYVYLMFQDSIKYAASRNACCFICVEICKKALGDDRLKAILTDESRGRGERLFKALDLEKAKITAQGVTKDTVAAVDANLKLNDLPDTMDMEKEKDRVLAVAGALYVQFNYIGHCKENRFQGKVPGVGPMKPEYWTQVGRMMKASIKAMEFVHGKTSADLKGKSVACYGKEIKSDEVAQLCFKSGKMIKACVVALKQVVGGGPIQSPIRNTSAARFTY